MSQHMTFMMTYLIILVSEHFIYFKIRIVNTFKYYLSYKYKVFNKIKKKT